ncbi:MAG TPA: hypothetical protein PKA00_18460 [Saprospiraceae bacterium]|nr:hypothetical protein [Saprospiraceae bacterium]HMQ84902.1 hypothetical protein [Saprospiraceae bacterium]
MMKQPLTSYCTILILALILVWGCVKPPDYPEEPVINYIGANKNQVFQGSVGAPQDTLSVTFGFTDGDADLGDPENVNVFFYDSRNELLDPIPIKLNAIPDQGTGNGISGEITVKIPNILAGGNICCIFPDGRVCQVDPEFPVDSFFYYIEIMDRAGHISNRIRTETITILCD